MVVDWTQPGSGVRRPSEVSSFLATAGLNDPVTGTETTWLCGNFQSPSSNSQRVDLCSACVACNPLKAGESFHRATSGVLFRPGLSLTSSVQGLISLGATHPPSLGPFSPSPSHSGGFTLLAHLNQGLQLSFLCLKILQGLVRIDFFLK